MEFFLDAKSLVGYCKDVVRLHGDITASMLENSDLLKQLDSSYAVDTASVSLKVWNASHSKYMRCFRTNL